MILLNGHSLSAKDWFQPEEMSLSLEERRSTATVQMAPEAPEVPVGSWLQDDEEPGRGIVWRARAVETIYNTDTRELQLEHIISTLKDQVMFGEVTPADIAGEGATDCTAEQAVRYILARQSIWQLGDFEFTDRNPYNFNGDTLFSALEMVSASLDGAIWEYDLGSLPFTLHIRKLPENATCEMREGRNIQSLRKVIDRSKMYTRFYPIGKDDLHITGDYVSKNENIWGVIERIETDSSRETEEALIRWANEKLSRHAEPIVTITISGFELSEATGESLDHLTICRKCRIPLPEYGTTITEKITKLRWPDKIKEKEKVTVTLANELDDIATIVQKQIDDAASGRGGGGRGGMKDAKEDHAWFVDTDSHVAMVAEALVGNGPGGPDWSRVAAIIVDGYGIHDRVTLTEGEIVILQAEIETTESHWRAQFDDLANSLHSEVEISASHLRTEFEDEVGSLRSEMEVTASHLRTEFEDEVGSLRSEIEVTASHLRTEFEDEVGSLRSEMEITASHLRTEFEDEVGSVRSEVEQTASSWNARVSGVVDANGNITAASIALAINNSTGQSEAKIDADRVYIGNNKSTTVINGKCALSDVTADYISAQIASLAHLTVTGLTVTGNLYVGAGQYAQNVTAAIWDLDLSQSGDTYTLKRRRMSDSGWVTVGTFSRATALTGAWSGGALTISASPQGNTFNAALQTEGHWGSGAGENSQHYYGSISAKHNGGSTSHQTGAYFEIDASGIYTSGYNAGKPISGTAGSRVATTNPAYNFNITKGDGTVATLQIDVTGIYADARSGYTEGTFSLATVTLQGTRNDNVYKVQNTGVSYYRADTALALYEAGTVTKYDRGTGLTARPVVNSGGTIYYEANAATTYYQAGTVTKNDRGTGYSVTPVKHTTATRLSAAKTVYPGDGGSFTPQGSAGIKVTRWGNGTLFKLTAGGTYESQGSHTWYYADSGGTQYYNAGSGTKHDRGTGITAREVLNTGGTIFYEADTAKTVYPGDGGSFTVQGDAVSVTPIKATSAIRLGASGTYYPGDGGSFTVQGTAKSVTPIKADSEKKLTGVTMYEAGTTYSNTYYTKS